MSPTLIQLFAFMGCTFVLGLFLGWALWRYGAASQDIVETLEDQAKYWKRSFDQSRNELWQLQESLGLSQTDPNMPGRAGPRTMKSRRPTSKSSQPVMSKPRSMPNALPQGK